jgi:hypothetical protein
VSDSATVTPPPDGAPVELDAVRAALAADYEILSELGRGGMAVVFRAREKELDREVAIKVLPAAMTFDTEFVERFQREARTAGKLEHPHIVPIYRVGRSNNVIYFVMKLLTGQSLAAVLRERRKLSAGEVRRIILETASALGYAAKRGVVHRDIKPDNILLDSEGRCVVTDFGIAKTSSGPMTAAGTSMGTPRYMSPEHASGARVDGRSDIYSLGVVAYQCLTGATPFDADDPFAVLYKHINEPIPRPDLDTDEEWALYAVIERMLAKKPEDRYQDADALIQALGGEVQTITLVNPQAVLQTTFGPTEIIATPLPWRHRRMGPATNMTWAVVAVFTGVAVLATAARATWGPSIEPVDSAALGAGPATAAGPDTGTTTAAVAAVAAAAAAIGRGSAQGGADSLRAPASGANAQQQTAASPGSARPPVPVGDPLSRCPRPGTAAARRLGVPGLLVDSVADIAAGGKVSVVYHVCGLGPNTAFTTHVTVAKTNQARLRRLVGASVKPLLFPFPDVATSSRVRRRRVLDLSGMDEGTYSVKVAVTDQRQRHVETERPFAIVKPEQPR